MVVRHCKSKTKKKKKKKIKGIKNKKFFFKQTKKTTTPKEKRKTVYKKMKLEMCIGPLLPKGQSRSCFE